MHDRSKDMLDFAIKWRFWGGGPAEDIFVQFGLTPANYYLHLDEIVASVQNELPPKLFDELKGLCDSHLGVSSIGVRRRI
jgi:hypothetical protein